LMNRGSSTPPIDKHHHPSNRLHSIEFTTPRFLTLEECCFCESQI
jgi:hypothetical protein